MALGEKSRNIAKRILPVLIYYASVLERPLTYGELSYITGDFPKALKFGFAIVHQWIEESAKRNRFESLPLAIIVVAKGKSVPGSGGIKWRLRENGITYATPELIADMIAGEQKRIFRFPYWSVVLKDQGLSPYSPKLLGIDAITAELGKRGGQGESYAHRLLKEFVGTHPESIGLPKQASLMGYEITLPSLDRADLVFQYKEVVYPIEVKSHEADEVELTRGIYQAIKYQCLFEAERKDSGAVGKVEARLVVGRLASDSEKLRCQLLGVRIVDGVQPHQGRSSTPY